MKSLIAKKSFRFTSDSKRLAQLKSKYKGKRCFVIGNGPSLNVSDLELIKDEYTFGCNMLYKIFGKTEFRPTFYVAADPNFFPDYMKEVLRYDIDTLFVTKYAKNKMNLPDNAYPFFVYGPFRLIKESLKNNEFSEDASKYLALSYTVTYYSLQLAAYLGFEKIVLLGIDHKYALTADSQGRIHIDGSVSESHFAEMGDKSNDSLQAIDSTTYSYITARNYAEKHGIEIINATRGGSLEVFKRQRLEDIVKIEN